MGKVRIYDKDSGIIADSDTFAAGFIIGQRLWSLTPMAARNATDLEWAQFTLDFFSRIGEPRDAYLKRVEGAVKAAKIRGIEVERTDGEVIIAEVQKDLVNQFTEALVWWRENVEQRSILLHNQEAAAARRDKQQFRDAFYALVRDALPEGVERLRASSEQVASVLGVLSRWSDVQDDLSSRAKQLGQLGQHTVDTLHEQGVRHFDTELDELNDLLVDWESDLGAHVDRMVTRWDVSDTPRYIALATKIEGLEERLTEFEDTLRRIMRRAKLA